MMRSSARQTIRLAVVGVALTCGTRHAVANDWKGTAANGLWTNASNWVALAEPTATGVAAFGAANNVTADVVTLDADRAIAAWQVTGTPNVGAYRFQRANNAVLSVSGNATFQPADPNQSLSLTADGFVAQIAGQAAFAKATTMALSGGASLHAANGIVLSDATALSLTNSSLTTGGTLQLSGTSQLTATGSTVTAADVIASSGTTSVFQAASALIASHSIAVDNSSLKFASSNLSLGVNSTVSVTGAAGKLTLGGSLALPTGVTLNADTGGRIEVPSYLDIGNGRVGTMILATNASCSASELSDWGRSAGSNAIVSISGGAAAMLTALRVGTSDSATTLNISSAGKLATTGTFEMGGGSVIRNCSMTLAGGVLEVGTAATFNDHAVVRLQSGGALNFKGDATFNAGTTLDWSGGGTLSLAPGKTLTFNGALVDRGSIGQSLPNGGALVLTAATQFGGTNFFDVANGVNTSGTMTLDGIQAAPTFTAGGTSSWGREAGASAVIQLQNSAQVNVAALRIGTNNSAATVNVTSGAMLTTSGILMVGGGSTQRAVALNISNATVNAQSATLNDKAVVNLSSGSLMLGGDSFINAGGTFNYSGGQFGIASGKVLRIAGGTMNVTTPGTPQSNGSTLHLSNGGHLVAEGFYDIGNGTMIIDAYPSNIIVNGNDFLTDWAYNPGNVANVFIQNSGGALYNAGVELGVGGGTANLTINTSGQLIAGKFIAGGLGTATMAFDVPEVALYVLDTATFNNGATLTIASGRVHVANTLALNGNAKILAASATSNVRINVGGLSIDEPSKIDLGSGTLNVSYVGASPAAAIRGYLLTGYHGGDWLGNGITSSRVASSAGSTLYYDDTGTTITVGRTIAGDFNLDQKVNFDDLILLAQNYNANGKLFRQGDATFDGVVNFDDLIKLAQNYNKTFSNVESATFSSSFAADWALAQSLLPEPYATLATIGAIGFAARRRATARRETATASAR